MSAHGTDSRYKHGCRCAACRRAHARAQRKATKARGAALTRLSNEYPERFQEILAEEKARVGVRLVPGRPRVSA